MDYASWPTKSINVTSLRLDTSNPRLANLSAPTQKELIQELISREHVLTLAGDISKTGFFPHEAMVVTKEGNHFVVLEGNRRLAALKILLNPELAPANLEKRLNHMKQHGAEIPSKVSVVIAPSRDAAIPLIMNRHTGHSVHRWTTVMQARFILSRIESGKTIEEVSQETGIERTEIQTQIRDARLYEVALSLPLPEKIQEIVADARKFPFTNLQRLIDTPSVRKALGITVSPKHGFTTSLAFDDFQRLLSKIVSDVALDAINSRSHNTAESIDKYVAELTKTGKPKTRKGEPTPAAEFVDPSKTQPKTARMGKSPPKSKSSKPVGLIPKGFRVDIEDDRITDIVSELKALNLTKFRNATAITYRSLLDMAVTRYLKDAGELKKVIAALNTDGKKKADWLPSLNQQLNHILKTPAIPLGPEGRKALQKFVSDSQSSLTLDALNWFTHIRYVPPTEEQLRAFWTMLLPLLELTLQQENP